MLRTPLELALAKSCCAVALFVSFAFPLFAQDLNTQLMDASRSRDAAEVRTLLARGADPNAKDARGRNALMEAASVGYTESILALLEKGADVNATDLVGWSPLFHAVFSRRTDTVRLLLEKGANVRARDKEGLTPLSVAASSGYTEIVRLLLAKGADTNAKDNHGWTPLMAAADLGHLETVRALLDRHADTQVRDKDGNTAQALAEKYKYAEVATLLKNSAQDPRDTRKTSGVVPAASPSAKSAPPTTAATPASSSVPNSASAASPTATDKSVPGPAASPAPAPKPASPAPETPVLSKSESLNKNLLEAAEAGDIAETLRLVREGAGVNSRNLTYGTTPLMGAAARGHTDTVRALIDRGGEVDAPDSAGHTALMEAAFGGYTNTVALLIEKGTNVNAQDNDGWTALFWATFSRRTDSVRLLLQKGADVNAKNKQEDTALIRASYGGDLDTLSVLLEHRPDLNAKDNFGRTALMEAAREDRGDAVNLLLQNGADATLKDNDGYTALSFATKLHFSRIVALLNSPREQNIQKVVADPATPTPPPQSPSEGAPVADDAKSNPLAAEVQTLREKSRARAFYRLGLSMRLLQSFWPQDQKEATAAAAKLVGDLREVDAPEGLIALAQRTFTILAYPPANSDAEIQLPLPSLRKRLDAYCQSQPDGSFFYAVGAYSYDLNLLGQYLTATSQTSPRTDVQDAHRRLLPLSTGFAAQCAAILECKDRALGFFSNSVAILQKPTLAPEDGAALREISNEIGVALGTQDR